MNYLQRRYNQVCIIVNYMIKLRCSVNSNLFENGAKRGQGLSMGKKTSLAKISSFEANDIKRKLLKGLFERTSVKLGLVLYL